MKRTLTINKGESVGVGSLYGFIAAALSRGKMKSNVSLQFEYDDANGLIVRGLDNPCDNPEFPNCHAEVCPQLRTGQLEETNEGEDAPEPQKTKIPGGIDNAPQHRILTDEALGKDQMPNLLRYRVFSNEMCAHIPPSLQGGEFYTTGMDDDSLWIMDCGYTSEDRNSGKAVMVFNSVKTPNASAGPFTIMRTAETGLSYALKGAMYNDHGVMVAALFDPDVPKNIMLDIVKNGSVLYPVTKGVSVVTIGNYETALQYFALFGVFSDVYEDDDYLYLNPNVDIVNSKLAISETLSAHYVCTYDFAEQHGVVPYIIYAENGLESKMPEDIAAAVMEDMRKDPVMSLYLEGIQSPMAVFDQLFDHLGYDDDDDYDD